MPRRRRGPGEEVTTLRQGPSVEHDTYDFTVADDLAAWRCWTWRDRHGCRCLRLADCLLHGPLPVHEPQPCPGEFTAAGWQPHCRGGVA